MKRTEKKNANERHERLLFIFFLFIVNNAFFLFIIFRFVVVMLLLPLLISIEMNKIRSKKEKNLKKETKRKDNTTRVYLIRIRW